MDNMERSTKANNVTWWVLSRPFVAPTYFVARAHSHQPSLSPTLSSSQHTLQLFTPYPQKYPKWAVFNILHMRVKYVLYSVVWFLRRYRLQTVGTKTNGFILLILMAAPQRNMLEACQIDFEIYSSSSSTNQWAKPLPKTLFKPWALHHHYVSHWVFLDKNK